MATVRESFSFPNVDFSWLGGLPERSEEARIRGLRQSLGDLGGASPGDLESAGGRLISGGDIEGGSKLIALANQRRGVDARAVDQEAYAKWLETYGRSLGAPRGATPDVAGPDPLITPPRPPGGDVIAPPVAPPAAVPAPPAWPTNPPVLNFPGPRAEIPSVLPPVPDEGRISTALAPPPVLPPGLPQVAAAGPMVQSPIVPAPAPPEPAPPAYTPGELPPGFDPRFSPAPPIAPPAAPVAPAIAPRAPVAPGQQGFYQADNAERIQALNDSRQIMNALIHLPPKSPTSAIQPLMAQLRESLSKQGMSKEETEYQLDRAQRIQMYGPAGDISIGDWRMEQKITPETYKKFEDVAQKNYLEPGYNARNVSGTLSILGKILDQPSFMSGPGSRVPAAVAGHLNTVIDFARQAGVPEEYLPRKEDIPGMSGLQLRDTFGALSNRIVTQVLGGLGNQISNSDRSFMERAFPSLLLTPQGNKLLIEVLQKASDNTNKIAGVVRQYQDEHRYRSNVFGLDKTVNDYIQNNPILYNKDGSLNDLGKRIEAQFGTQPGETPATGGAYRGKTVPEIIQQVLPAPGTTPRPPAVVRPQGAPAGAIRSYKRGGKTFYQLQDG